MDKLRSVAIAAAIAMALGACASNETAPDETTTATTGGSTTASSQTFGAYPDSQSATTAPTQGTTSADASAGATTGSDPYAADSAAMGSVAIGLSVESEAGESLGTVTDILADPTTGAPLFAVISTQGEVTAMPYTAASSMVQADALVVDRTRLASAPRIEQGELHEPSATWTSEANAYWGQGEMRTASPEPSAGDPGASEEMAEEEMPDAEPRG